MRSARPNRSRSVFLSRSVCVTLAALSLAALAALRVFFAIAGFQVDLCRRATDAEFVGLFDDQHTGVALEFGVYVFDHIALLVELHVGRGGLLFRHEQELIVELLAIE